MPLDAALKRLAAGEAEVKDARLNLVGFDDLDRLAQRAANGRRWGFDD